MAYELKTKQTDSDVMEFLNQTDEKRKDDVLRIHKMMEEISGEKGKMWGSSIVGYGSYHYKYASGQEGDWMLLGFSPRKQNITLYIMSGFDDYDDLMNDLGKHSTGKSCLYIKRLSDIDEKVLRELIKKSVDHMRKTNS